MTELTISEARAEAVAVVLKIIIIELRGRRRRELQKLARRAAKNIGHKMVSEEIDWLFS
jgi:hypothetical protein